MMVDLKACNELADSLAAEIKTRKAIEDNDNKIIDNQDLQIVNLHNQVKEQQTIIDLTDKQGKRKDRKIKFQKIIIGILAAVGLGEAGYIGIKAIAE